MKRFLPRREGNGYFRSCQRLDLSEITYLIFRAYLPKVIEFRPQSRLKKGKSPPSRLWFPWCRVARTAKDEEAETKSSIEINERRPLGNIQNGLLESNDHTPNRDGSDLSIKSEASKGMENTLIRRKKMQGIKGIGWRRRAEQRMIRMEEQIEEVIKINKNDEKFVGNTVNLEESIVIENGEQVRIA
ncbi:Protein of unknown function [Cotesia congregata]|uniref:Uncharacterized protein n=1 Tax=Cotesia congregata TaxID=51543 RepID=A0A8J2E8X5_COTCN|nr:Protein of unknown function [Cotesia congregata]